MTVVIKDEKAVAEVERLAAGLALPPDEVVRIAILEKAEREPETKRQLTPDEKRASIRKFQAWYAAYRDPNDKRTADEIIGYNESGSFD
jgi:hypothetical protein